MLDEYYIPRATQVTVSHSCTNENNFITVHMHVRINLSIFENKAKITRHKVSAIHIIIPKNCRCLANGYGVL